jgi:hypothetical protein
MIDLYLDEIFPRIEIPEKNAIVKRNENAIVKRNEDG